MVKYDVFCKGPFPDGRGHECWVQIGCLELPMTTDPRNHLSGYMCCTCGTAETILRPLCEQNLIPWWDPEYRKTVIRALDAPCRVFPYEKLDPNNPMALSDHQHRMANAVAMALGPLVRQFVPEREMVRRIMQRGPRPVKIIEERKTISVVGG